MNNLWALPECWQKRTHDTAMEGGGRRTQTHHFRVRERPAEELDLQSIASSVLAEIDRCRRCTRAHDMRRILPRRSACRARRAIIERTVNSNFHERRAWRQRPWTASSVTGRDCAR